MLLVASTAFQLFVLEPTQRRNDQKEMSFLLAQTVQATRAATALDNRIILKALRANSMDIKEAMKMMNDQIKRANENVFKRGKRNYQQGRKSLIDEEMKRYVTLFAFLFGSLLIGLGRYEHLKREASLNNHIIQTD